MIELMGRFLATWLSRLLIAAALAMLATAVLPALAGAQTVVAVVNGDPLTNFDVEQRAKLTELATHKPAPRHETLEDLINEKLKLQLVKRFVLEGIDKDTEVAFANMARRMRQTPKEFTDTLARQGIKVETLKSRMKADIIWSQIIRGRYQSAFQFSDKDVKARAEAKNPEEAATPGYDYTLRPILFVVPRGSPQPMIEARIKEAEALRARFQSCEQGIPLARGMGSVAVRPPQTKVLSDLAPALRDILIKTEIGRLTPPEITREGVEVYAVCSKVPSETTPAQRAIREEMYNEAFESQAKKLLKELRSQALIEYR